MQNPSLPKRPAKLEAIVSALMCTPVRVNQIETLTPHFKRIELEAMSDKNVLGRPGDKLQVRVDAWTFRTFTPLSDAAMGAPANPKRTHLVCFQHGANDGLAERFINSLSVGDTFEVFGPRASLPLTELEGPLSLFGDETSVAVAAALCAHDPTARVVLESRVAEETRTVLARIGVTTATVVERAAGDAHLQAVCDSLGASERKLVFTGKASSIQAVRTLLAKDKPRILKTKAYWAPGKRGLD